MVTKTKTAPACCFCLVIRDNKSLSPCHLAASMAYSLRSFLGGSIVAFHENVWELCERLGVRNPIREEDLTIAKMTFVTPDATHEVLATSMNRTGRLFLQSHADEAVGIQLQPLQSEAQQFFTSTLWNDCTPQRQALIWGIKNAVLVLIERKRLSAS